MYRLLIVDDEHHVVDWLVELFTDHSALDLEIYKAYTGMEALDILDALKIDVVLCDIKMPGISGFELADRIRENWPKACVIFLTGYDEFNYAYKANQYKNVRYLLKTEEDETIISAVAASLDSIEEELANALLLHKAIDQEKLMNHKLRREIFLDHIRRKDEKGGVAGWSGLDLPIDLQSPVILLLGRFKWNLEFNSYADHGKHILTLQQLLDANLADKGTAFVLDMDRHSFLCLLQPSGSPSKRRDECNEPLILYVKEMLDCILLAYRQTFHCEVLFLLYDHAVPWNQIDSKADAMNLAALNEMRTGAAAAACSFMIGEQDIDRVAEENLHVLKDPFMKKNLNQLQDLLELGEKSMFENTLGHITSVVEKIKSLHFYPAIEIYLHISNLYLSYINRYHFAEKLSFRVGLHKLYNLEEFSSWKEAFSFLQKVGSLLFELNTSDQMDKNEAFVERIRKYISENLDRELSLTVISESVNYNPSYVSRLFKQMAGVNLFDYINTTKLDYAKNQLAKTEETIQGIARQVGFESPQYFSTMFKKNTGMTPQEYRNKFSLDPGY